MKRQKSLIFGLCAFMLSFALAFGSVNYTYAPLASAADVDSFLLEDVNIRTSVTYGDKFDVPTKAGYTAKVTAPNGTEAAVTAEKVTADQLGNYIVTYSNESGSYSFKVYCSLDEQLELFVRNEAAIPTYVKKGDAKKLPEAYVGYYDEDGKLVELDAASATFTVKTDKGETITPGSDFTFANEGSTFVVYSAQIKGGTKNLSKTYEVKVQDDFTDTKAPTLSVSGVPSTANVNREVMLPVATASDSFDERVEVTVQVQGRDDNGNLVNVKKVTVDDKTGLATAELTEDEVFDNDKNMSFYPVREGDYRVTYRAQDDNGNKSAEWTYTISCSDKRAPEITLDETLIPSNWAYGTVIKRGETDGETEELSGEAIALNFAFPEVVDNKDAADAITIAFTIRDPESKTVVNFTNINAAAGASGTTYTNSTMGDKGSFKFDNTMKESGFSFNFGDYVEAVKGTDEDYVYAGDYVVTYSAQDAEGNRSTRTYTINVAETFEDTDKITVEFNNLPKYVLAVEDDEVEFVVPTPTVASANDSKLTVKYDISNGEAEMGASLKGGETMVIRKAASEGYELYYEDEDLTLALTDKIVLKASARSDAGNEEASVDSSSTITFLSPAAEKMYGDVTLDGLTTEGFKSADRTHELGSFTIGGISKDDRKYVGVELGVKNEKGEYLTGFSAEIYNVISEETVTKVVRNITMDTNEAGTYYLEIKVYDINGNSRISVIAITVEETSTDDDFVASATNADTAVVGSSHISLECGEPNTTALDVYLNDVAVNKCYSHTIAGGRFALMGEELTFLTNGKFEVTDNVVVVTGDNVTDYAPAADRDGYESVLASYRSNTFITVSDDTHVNFELQGIMPTYVALNGRVDLPQVAAFTTNGNADEIVLDVKSPTGVKVTPFVSGEETGYLPANGVMEAGKTYCFTATNNGTYIVTYTVKMSSKEESTFSYTIKAVDVIAPTFTLSGTHEQSVHVGYVFEFLVIETDEDPANLTFTKRVAGPNGEVVGNTISGKGPTYARRTTPTGGAFTLDAVGKYTVTYSVTDEAGNVSTKEFEITVATTGGSSGIVAGSDDSKHDAIMIGVIVSVWIFTAVAIAVVAIVCFLRRRRRSKSANTDSCLKEDSSSDSRTHGHKRT